MNTDEAYHKYNHLDELLSDRAWLPDDLIGEVLYDLWQTVKEEQYSGTVSKQVGPVILRCTSQEAVNLVKDIMGGWDKHTAGLKGTNPDYAPSFYALVYWLVRWSGLVKPATKR